MVQWCFLQTSPPPHPESSILIQKCGNVTVVIGPSNKHVPLDDLLTVLSGRLVQALVPVRNTVHGDVAAMAQQIGIHYIW